jgi:hypothetical protein
VLNVASVLEEVVGKAPSKGYLGIGNEEDVLDNPATSPLALLIEDVLIPDLDMKVLVLEILSDDLDLLLAGEFPSSVCLPAEVVIIFSSEYWKAFLLEQLGRYRVRGCSAVDCRPYNSLEIS